MSKTYSVRAVRWPGGWELHVEGEGVTQVRTLDKAVDQVRDYVATLRGREMSHAVVVVSADLDGLESEVADARRAITMAADAQLAAASRSRKVVRELRNRGLSVTDTAAVLGVSRGRISQLMRATQTANADRIVPSTAPR